MRFAVWYRQPDVVALDVHECSPVTFGRHSFGRHSTIVSWQDKTAKISNNGQRGDAQVVGEVGSNEGDAHNERAPRRVKKALRGIRKRKPNPRGLLLATVCVEFV